ncbi:MAG TPA: hypothetical protein VFE82_12060 [Ramlibacter sp.]|jgi:hypothetical protein|uniref:hypothetical protein n=1 Tax=Ramlibacter sp. TaxID=1917967 RepID=UPI002D4CE468|nr:hypothetical protein [Ramlibacter sp.]HZY19206.1 hypothetical protein [Ramlibacter sp.]
MRIPTSFWSKPRWTGQPSRDCIFLSTRLKLIRTLISNWPSSVGAPAKVLRELTDEEVANLRANAADYARKSEAFRHGTFSPIAYFVMLTQL